MHGDGDVGEQSVIPVLLQLRHDLLRRVVLVAAECKVEEGDDDIGEEQRDAQRPLTARGEEGDDAQHREYRHEHR